MIEPFHPDRMASRILGMGDVLSFIEKAEAAYDEKQATKLEEKLRKNRFTLQDYYDQLQQLRGMGDLSQLAGMMPGGLGKQLQGASIDEKQMAHTEAIILSMTPLERENPKVLNASRKRRIAAGCGLEMVKIRLRRMGAKKAPFYRVVVADSRYPRDGRFIEEIGTYNPCVSPAAIKIDAERAQAWIKSGAQPTATVRALLKKVDVL